VCESIGFTSTLRLPPLCATRNVADLRLKNKLAPLWPKAAAMAQQNSASAPATVPVAHGMR
jgi:hypothetical protein